MSRLLLLAAIIALAVAQSCPSRTLSVLQGGINTRSSDGQVTGSVLVNKNGVSFTAQQSIAGACDIALVGVIDTEDANFNITFTQCTASCGACSAFGINLNQQSTGQVTYNDTTCNIGTIGLIGQTLLWKAVKTSSTGSASLAVGSLVLAAGGLAMLFAF